MYIITSLYDYNQRFTCGEYLLRCGINTSIIYFIKLITNTVYTIPPGEQVFHASAQPYSLSRGTDLPCNCATLQSLPGNRFSAHPQGFWKPHTGPSPSRLPRKGGYPQLLRKRLTLIPGLVRRPQHLPLGCQPRSPERSTHDSLSIYRNAELLRTRNTTLPDSTAQRKRPAGQPHFSSIYPPQITRTS